MRGDLVAERFRVGEQVGAGAMGTVHRALDESDGSVVALKFIRTEVADASARFERETLALSKLDHPNVVRYISRGSTSGTPFLVMEWLEGEDLARRLKRSGLTFAETLAVAKQLADALVAVHAAGIIHRDLKPGNVFFPGGDLNALKLVDFGLARIHTQSDFTSLSGMLVGTPGYMAPEQARGQRDVDGRVDVFALGCLLYKCLAGHGPFAAPDAIATLAKVLFDEPKPLFDVRPDIPRAFGRLIDEMLVKERDNRPHAIAVRDTLGSLGAFAPSSERIMSRESMPALTEREQRIVSVVVAAYSDIADAEATIERAPQPALAGMEASIVSLGEQLGARVEVLANGLVATLFGRGSATDQAQRAAKLAIAMRSKLGDTPVALATGRAEVGQRVVGEVIDRAVAHARRDAAFEGVWLDDVTAGLLGVEFDVIDHGEAKELLRAKAGAAPAMRTLLGRPTPCVGRDRELLTLDALMDECVSEPAARAAVVMGGAGVGKSRLRFEWLTRVERRSPAPNVLVARADPLASSAPFFLAAQWVRAAARFAPSDDPATTRERLTSHVRGLPGMDDPDRVAQFLGELVGVPFPSEDSVQLRAARQDLVLMGDQTRRAAEQWLRAEAERRPLVLVLEDLHWGDLPTVKLVDSALKNLAASPIFVFALARPELEATFPALWSERAAETMRLVELTPKASAKLVRAVLGEDAPAAVVERIATQSAGNAFFLEEILRAHVQGQGDDVPKTVRAMMQRRLEGLEPQSRRVLRAASIFGQTFWVGAAMALLGGESNPLTQIGGWLAKLEEAEVVSRRSSSRFAGQQELVFRHAIVRDAAYDMLTDEDRALGHRLAAQWLEQQGERDAAVLAEHFDRGHAPEPAIAYYRRATAQALEGSDLPAVIALGERAVALGAAGEALGELRRYQAEAYRWQGKLADAENAAAEAVKLLPQGNALWYSAISEHATASAGVGHHEALEQLRDALSNAKPPADPSAYVTALSRLAGQLFATGKRDWADALVTKADLFAVPSDGIAAARREQARAYHALYSSDPATYYEHTAAARHIFEAAGDRRNACVQAINMGYIAISLGALDEAEAALTPALALATSMGLARLAALSTQNLACVLYEHGKVAQSIELQQTALASLLAQNDRRLAAHSHIYLSQAFDAAGRVDEAFVHAAAAREVSASIPPAHVLALVAQADLELAHRTPREALVTAEKAHALLEELGGVEDSESLVRVVYAEALHANGRFDDAKGVIVREIARLAVQLAKIKNASWRKSFLARVGSNARVIARAKDWAVPTAALVQAAAG